MSVTRLRHIPGIGVDSVGDKADAAHDPSILRLENLDTDLRPPAAAVEATRRAIDDDGANSYLPFQGHWPLREAVAAHVGRISGVAYDPGTQCLSVAGGLNGITNALLATVEPGQEVVLFDPIYAGLVNRVRLAGGIPRHVPSRPTGHGWRTDPDELAAAIGANTAAVRPADRPPDRQPRCAGGRLVRRDRADVSGLGHGGAPSQRRPLDGRLRAVRCRDPAAEPL